jgi:putative phage-type endonuclease
MAHVSVETVVVPQANLDARRATDVTASNVSAICGECPFRTRRGALYTQALRLHGDDTPATIHGRVHEPTALRRFCEETGAVVVEYPCGYVRHSTYAWLGGTMDAKVKLTNGDIVIIEIKCPISRQIKDEVPMHYVGQVQTYLYLMPDCEYLLFVQYKPAGPRSKEKLQITRVERDPDYMALRMPGLKRYWDELQMWMAYVDRIVTVLQRAWRSYRAKRGVVVAARDSMRMRLKCARMVGKMAGFCRVRDAQMAPGIAVPKPRENDGTTTFVESFDRPVYKHGCAAPPEAKRPRRTAGSLLICD